MRGPQQARWALLGAFAVLAVAASATSGDGALRRAFDESTDGFRTLDTAISTFGNGTAVTCATTPADADDTSVANTSARYLTCANPSSNAVTVRLGGATVGANAAGLEPGQTWNVRVAADVVPKCYAASSTTIQCTESL